MLFYINKPPVRRQGSEKQMEELVSWLYTLTDALTVAFANIGMENLSEELRDKINERSGK